MARRTLLGSIVWETARLKRPKAASVMAVKEGIAGILMLLALVDF